MQLTVLDVLSSVILTTKFAVVCIGFSVSDGNGHSRRPGSAIFSTLVQALSLVTEQCTPDTSASSNSISSPANYIYKYLYIHSLWLVSIGDDLDCGVRCFWVTGTLFGYDRHQGLIFFLELSKYIAALIPPKGCCTAVNIHTRCVYNYKRCTVTLKILHSNIHLPHIFPKST